MHPRQMWKEEEEIKVITAVTIITNSIQGLNRLEEEKRKFEAEGKEEVGK